MAPAVTIRKVENHADFRAFFEFPWTLYADDPNWVPTLLSARRELLDKQKNPSWEYMEGDYFTAWRGDRIVGTIAAFVNHRHNEFAQENIGWFGMFEVYEDQEAASALLNTALEWVRSHGYDALRGPQSFTTHEECGLLVENFSRPVLLMPYNKPYYQRLVETAGFHKVMDIHSLYFDEDTVDAVGGRERLRRITERAQKRAGLTLRPFDLSRKKEEFRLFKDLYNQAWSANWGFVPMTDRELDNLIEELGQFFDPKLAFFAEVHGEPAGFVLSIPDFNIVLHKAYPRPGTPEIVTLLKAAWYWKVRRMINSARVPLMGVRPEFRDRGIDLALIYSILLALIASNYDYVDCGWILETNELMSIADKIGGKIYKTHRFYEKPAR